ncbi:MAG: hypothetical protein RL637_1476 [Pseudomonadota bacterium]|jgi:ribosome-associated protein
MNHPPKGIEIDIDNEKEFDWLNVDDEEIIVNYAIRPNKTQIKKEIAEIFEFAQQLTHLSTHQLAQLSLPEYLIAAIMLAGKLPPTAARKRQLKYITAELRQLNLADIQTHYAQLKQQTADQIRIQHQAEKWRDYLINNGNAESLTELFNEYPEADRQKLRQLQRQAKKEKLAAQSPKSARLLYQALKQLIESSSTINAETDSDLTDIENN